jgi:hypothetical protein
MFDAGASPLLAAIDRVPPRRTSRSRATEDTLDVAAHGIFVLGASAGADGALAAWAARRGIAPQAALPDTPRVPYRTNGEQNGDIGARRGLLKRCTLEHEHFHSILEVGLDANQMPARANPDGWKHATALNEALAAWMEVHYRRHADALGAPEDVGAAQAAVSAYIRAGDCPDWPYRGAEVLETLYSEGGLHVVRDLVPKLCEDPRGAMLHFENAMH